MSQVIQGFGFSLRLGPCWKDIWVRFLSQDEFLSTCWCCMDLCLPRHTWWANEVANSNAITEECLVELDCIFRMSVMHGRPLKTTFQSEPCTFDNQNDPEAKGFPDRFAALLPSLGRRSIIGARQQRSNFYGWFGMRYLFENVAGIPIQHAHSAHSNEKSTILWELRKHAVRAHSFCL